MSRLVKIFTVFLILTDPGVALAQSNTAVATLVRTEGVVYLNDQPVAGGAVTIDLGAVGRVRTENGRATVSLKRGGALVLADHTSVSVVRNGVYTFDEIELFGGSAVVVSAPNYTEFLAACGMTVHLSSAGVFRFDVQPDERLDFGQRCDFRVYEGAGTTPGASASYILRAGERMRLNRRAGDFLPVNSFSPAELDEFDRWARQQAAATVR